MVPYSYRVPEDPLFSSQWQLVSCVCVGDNNYGSYPHFLGPAQHRAVRGQLQRA